MLGKQLIQAAAGSAAAGGGLYVDDVFSTFLYEGNSTARPINNDIDLSGEGGLVWIKTRAAGSHRLVDTERTATKRLSTDSNNPEGTDSTGLTSFTSTGFTLGLSVDYNDNNDYVSWTFRKAPGFFDICEWTGNSVSGRQIAHNLGSAPGFIMVKSYVAGTGGTGWMCYHRSLGNTKAIRMDNGTGETTASSAYWNNTDPTSTHFTVGNYEDINTSANSRSYIAYVFAHDSQVFGTDSDEAIIKCGSYTGNGSTAGPVVDLGFEPQWLMIKRSDYASNWLMYDMMRGAGVPNQTTIAANSNGVEFSYSSVALDFQPTGFQIKSSSASTINANGGNYIYMAIRRPNKPPTAGTEVYKSVVGSDTIATATGFTVDMALSAYQPGNSYNHVAIDRFRSRSTLTTSNNTAENANFFNAGAFATNDGMNARALWGANSLYHFFRRAPGFMDVVAYEGNATAGTAIAHNLEAVPEFIICKCRNQGAGFWCYHKDLSTNYAIRMDGASNGSVAEQGASNYWNSSTHSATTFTLGDYGDINGSAKTFISYLFATSAGISKIGNFTGTGNAINVDCGFSSGARLILIKRKDASGDWFIYNSASGIVSGNDPYLLLNTTAAEVTNTDYIDPLSSGFTVTSSAPTGLNASGGTYIFLAIA